MWGAPPARLFSLRLPDCLCLPVDLLSTGVSTAEMCGVHSRPLSFHSVYLTASVYLSISVYGCVDSRGVLGAPRPFSFPCVYLFTFVYAVLVFWGM